MKNIKLSFGSWAAIWTILYILAILYLNFSWYDAEIYQRVSNSFFAGRLPYRDEYFEYPPGSLIIFLVIGLFAHSTEVYRFILSLVCVVMGFVTIWAAARTAEIIIPPRKAKIHLLSPNTWVWAVGTVSFFIMSPLFLARYDIFPAMLSSLGVLCYVTCSRKNLKQPGKFERYRELGHILAYVLIFIGGLAKLYPFLLMPILAIYDIKQKNFPVIIKGFVTCVVVMLPFLALIIVGWDGFLWFLNYHSSRGLEIESLYSSALLLLHQVNILKDVQITYAYSSYGIIGQIPDILAKFSPLIFIVVYLIVLAGAWFNPKQTWKTQIIAMFASVLAFVILNKIFSTQYILWLAPFWFLWSAGKFSRMPRSFIFFLLCVISVMIYPLMWTQYINGDLSLTIAMLVRNLILLWTLFELLKSLYATINRIPNKVA